MLLQVQYGDIIVMDLTRRHESSHFSLSQFFLFAIYRLWRKTDPSLVELSGDDDGLAPENEVVAVDVVCPSKC